MSNIDLRDLTFSDEEESKENWIELFPFGKYDHPVYKDVYMNEKRANNIIDNFNNKVMDVDVAVNYNHKREKAAGWINELQVKDNGLWGKVEWTEPGANSIRNGEFRYFSPEFAPEWAHPKSGDNFTDVLTGGALTNNPFLKGIKQVQTHEEVDMTFKENIIKSLDLGEDATDEQIFETLQKLSTPEEPEAAPVEQKLEEAGLPDVIQTLQEYKQIMEDNQKTINELKFANALNEAQAFVDGLETNNFSLPVAVHEPVKEILLSVTPQIKEKFVTLLEEITTNGVIGKERGHVNRSNPVDSPFSHLKFEEGEDPIQKMKQAARDNPDLYYQYRMNTGKQSEENPVEGV